MKLDKENKELYYLENGRVVFTEQYHINRGHCCGNNCRHCPYEPKNQKGNTTLIKKNE
jgi:2-iminoacetate synthase ThiH